MLPNELLISTNSGLGREANKEESSVGQKGIFLRNISRLWECQFK